jgi:hypothetical protein
MGNVLLLLGIGLIVGSAFMVSVTLGLFAAGLGCLLLAVALADGRGVQWRRRS